MPDQEEQSRLTVQEYQEKALSADQLADATLAVPLLGLFGETGSLLNEAKKKHRDAVSYTRVMKARSLRSWGMSCGI
jgi:hypothetical protein